MFWDGMGPPIEGHSRPRSEEWFPRATKRPLMLRACTHPLVREFFGDEPLARISMSCPVCFGSAVLLTQHRNICRTCRPPPKSPFQFPLCLRHFALAFDSGSAKEAQQLGIDFLCVGPGDLSVRADYVLSCLQLAPQTAIVRNDQAFVPPSTVRFAPVT